MIWCIQDAITAYRREAVITTAAHPLGTWSLRAVQVVRDRRSAKADTPALMRMNTGKMRIVNGNVPATSYVLITMPIDPDQTATIVTSRAIRAGYEQDFERWWMS